jgi:hypothetical protein
MRARRFRSASRSRSFYTGGPQYRNKVFVLPLRNMSCVVLLWVLRRAKAAFFICFAIGLLLSGAQTADALNHEHPPSTVLQLQQTIAPGSEAGATDPCMNTGHRVAHCCSALHCMAGFAAVPATLPSPALESPFPVETAGLPSSRIPDRLDRPPKP